MNINVSTKYSIGDKVWVFRFISEDREYKDWSYGIEERSIAAVRVSYYNPDNSSDRFNADTPHIQYFLSGLHSYEGENWFNEEVPSSNGYYNEGIFSTKEEAEAYMKQFIKDREE